MKKLAIVGLLALLAVGFFLAGCGTTKTPAQEAGGNWEATFAAGDPPVNQTLFNFETSFSVSGSGALVVTNLNFLTAGPCFAASGLGATVGGKWDVTSAPSDPIAQANVTFTVQGGGNTLSLTGTATGVENTVTQVASWNSVTGSWALTGNSNCIGSATAPGGTFKMCPNATTCTTT